MRRKCQFRTHAAQQKQFLFNHPVGAQQDRRGHVDTEVPRGFEVDHELELGRLLDW
jgi:hypothetical protein